MVDSSTIRYRLFDGIVASDIPLTGLPVAEIGDVDIRLLRGSGSVSDHGYTWLNSWLQNDGEPTLACARKRGSDGASRYLLRFPDLADFVIVGDVITCHAGQGCREDSLRHLVLDQVMPRLWAHRGNLVLHASAVQLPGGRAVAFLGESGWGKSTLAAALRLRGCRLLSDDSISIRADEHGAHLLPAYCGLRLNDDSIASLGLAEQARSDVCHYSDKRRFEMAVMEHDQDLVIDTLFIMRAPSNVHQPSLEAMAGAGLIATLIKGSFLLDVHDHRSALQQIELAIAALGAIPRVYALDYKRDYQQLSTLCDMLL